MYHYPLLYIPIPGTVAKLIITLGIPLALYVIVMAIKAISSTRMFFVKLRQFNVTRSYPYDPRPPVLYLRSFKSDGSGSSGTEIDLEKFGFRVPFELPDIRFTQLNLEYRLANTAGQIGPVIAIGDPGKRTVQEFGAVREYYSNEEWQATALEKMKRASMIILRSSYGDGKGILWEEEQLRNSFLKKTIFLLEVKGSVLEKELIRKLPGDLKGLSALDETRYPCCLEFLDERTVAVSRDMAQTALFQELFHLLRHNRHYMYCTNCGEANKTESHYCVKCGHDLTAQQIPPRKKRFDPFLGVITSDSGYLLISLLFVLNPIINYWFFHHKETHPEEPVKGAALTADILYLVVGILIDIVLIAFTANIRRQLLILFIALLLLANSIYFDIRFF
jgi:hypothetical protein